MKINWSWKEWGNDVRMIVFMIGFSCVTLILTVSSILIDDSETTRTFAVGGAVLGIFLPGVVITAMAVENAFSLRQRWRDMYYTSVINKEKQKAVDDYKQSQQKTNEDAGVKINKEPKPKLRRSTRNK